MHDVCVRLQAVGTALTDSAQQSISGQKQSAKVEPGFVYSVVIMIWCQVVIAASGLTTWSCKDNRDFSSNNNTSIK